MASTKFMNEKQKEALAKHLQDYQDYQDCDKMDTTTQFLTVGEEFEEPHIVIVNQGDLGIGFIDTNGKSSWLNSIGEHMLLQFLIDKQYGSNEVRNSKEMIAGRDDGICC